jgi:AcrR family transcriptional regulator
MQLQKSRRDAKPSSRGDQTRAGILSKAVEIASREGLESLTIGRLAGQLSMSKSGLFAHFGSKQKLQLATIERAKEAFTNDTLIPSEAVPAGLARLWSLCDLWMKSIEQGKHSSAHFFAAAIFYYGCRPGPIARANTAVMRERLNALKRTLREASRLKEIEPDTDLTEIPGQLTSILIGAYGVFLLGERDAFTEARSQILGRLRSLATDEIPPDALESVKAWRKYLEKIL